MIDAADSTTPTPEKPAKKAAPKVSAEEKNDREWIKRNWPVIKTQKRAKRRRSVVHIGRQFGERHGREVGTDEHAVALYEEIAGEPLLTPEEDEDWAEQRKRGAEEKKDRDSIKK